MLARKLTPAHIAPLAIAAIAAVAFITFDAQPSAAVEFQLCKTANQQNCVVDGDTIHYAGVIIRLADIDAPETHKASCASEAALGKRATNRLLELMNAGPFTVVSSGNRDHDQYGRKLRLIVYAPEQ